MRACVCDLRRDIHRLAAAEEFDIINCKIGIAEAKAERVKHPVLGKALKPPVADIDILGIEIIIFTAEILGARIIVIITRYRVGQLAAR